MPIHSRYLKSWKQYTKGVSEENISLGQDLKEVDSIDEALALSNALLAEGRKEDVIAKYPELHKHGLLKYFIDKDPSEQKNQKYLPWMAKQMEKNFHWPEEEFAQEDNEFTADTIATLVRRYHNYLPYIKKDSELKKYTDINTLKSVKALDDLVEKAADIAGQSKRKKTQKSNTSKQAERESRVIADNDDYKIIRPNTEFASCHFGQGSRWCISATKSRNYFKDYTIGGKAFYFIYFKKATGSQSRYVAMADSESEEFEKWYDLEDRSIDSYDLENELLQTIDGDRDDIEQMIHDAVGDIEVDIMRNKLPEPPSNGEYEDHYESVGAANWKNVKVIFSPAETDEGIDAHYAATWEASVKIDVSSELKQYSDIFTDGMLDLMGKSAWHQALTPVISDMVLKSQPFPLEVEIISFQPHNNPGSLGLTLNISFLGGSGYPDDYLKYLVNAGRVEELFLGTKGKQMIDSLIGRVAHAFVNED